MPTANLQRRRYHLTPGRILLGLLILECLLWLSERFQWFGLNRHKGWAVLIIIAAVVAVMLMMLLWFTVSAIFRWRFQFGIRTLLVLVVVVALPCSWFTVERRQRSLTLEGKAEAAVAELLDGHTLEGLECGHGGLNLGRFKFAPGECGELIKIFRDLVKNGNSMSKPWDYSAAECQPALGTDCISFPPVSLAEPDYPTRYAIFLDVGSFATKYSGSIGFIRLVLFGHGLKCYILKQMPLYPADLDRIKDAVERARHRQAGQAVSTEKEPEPL